MAAKETPFAGFVSTLVDREEIAEGTMAFHFAKPPGFNFKAGQATDVTLLDPPEIDSEGNIRTFSIASPPYEDRVTIATRMRDSAFKRSLKKVPIGTVIKFATPSGSFTLHKNASRPAVFLAGGIGVTPFLSIIRQADHDRLPHTLYLFYSNRRPEDAAFLDALQSLASSRPNFQLIATMTQMAGSSRTWNGEVGFITGEMLARHLRILQGPIYYIAGPPAMVAGLRDVVVGAHVDEDDIRTEDFAGY